MPSLRVLKMPSMKVKQVVLLEASTFLSYGIMLPLASFWCYKQSATTAYGIVAVRKVALPKIYRMFSLAGTRMVSP